MDEQAPDTRRQRGRFIVIEGIDGSGSTTHGKLLMKALKQRGHDVLLTCEPTSGPVGSLIRQVLQKRVHVMAEHGPRAFSWSTMALLFAADRIDHLESEIIPALRAGTWVVSDRYDISSLAYQSVTAPSPEKVVPWIRQLNVHALRPDLTIVLDVPAEIAAERRGSRGSKEELFERAELQKRLAAVYAEAESLVPGDPLVHVSGIGEVADVSRRVLEAVLARDFEVESSR
jgi:dTMP kinase